VFNPRFRPGGPPPPFNWRYSSGSAGVAEPQTGGGLRVLHYGREDAVLVEQLLLLGPGRHRLRQNADGPTPNLQWSLSCLPSGGTQDGPDFTVSASCPAQQLQMRGTGADTAATTDVLIRSVTLSSPR
jgi:hypothetical protein